jgi:hypothetical protein
MEAVKLWARNGEAVRQGVELGEIVHISPVPHEPKSQDTESQGLDLKVLISSVSRLRPNASEYHPYPIWGVKSNMHGSSY